MHTFFLDKRYWTQMATPSNNHQLNRPGEVAVILPIIDFGLIDDVAWDRSTGRIAR
jgi:hypothetical protein